MHGVQRFYVGLPRVLKTGFYSFFLREELDMVFYSWMIVIAFIISKGKW